MRRKEEGVGIHSGRTVLATQLLSYFLATPTLFSGSIYILLLQKDEKQYLKVAILWLIWSMLFRRESCFANCSFLVLIPARETVLIFSFSDLSSLLPFSFLLLFSCHAKHKNRPLPWLACLFAVSAPSSCKAKSHSVVLQALCFLAWLFLFFLSSFFSCRDRRRRNAWVDEELGADQFALSFGV